MLYIGSGLEAPTGVVDPALIDPGLRVAQRRPDHAGDEMGYWPSYSEIPAPCRAAYLHWLAAGRCDPDAYIGYVFLYFYGLERLVIVDAPAHPALGAHIGAVIDEVRRLLLIYSDNYSFRSYAEEFLDLIETATLLSTDEPLRPPARDGERWPVPAALRVGLGRFARDGEPIPAEWARAWAWFHPNLYPRTPQTRCAEEFDALFRIRYTQQHGDGITVRNVRQRLTGGSYPDGLGRDRRGQGPDDRSAGRRRADRADAQARGAGHGGDRPARHLQPLPRQTSRRPRLAARGCAAAR